MINWCANYRPMLAKVLCIWKKQHVFLGDLQHSCNNRYSDFQLEYSGLNQALNMKHCEAAECCCLSSIMVLSLPLP